MSSLNKRRGITLNVNTREPSRSPSPIRETGVRIPTHIMVKDDKTGQKKLLPVHMDKDAKKLYLEATARERKRMLYSKDNIHGGNNKQVNKTKPKNSNKKSKK